MVNISPYISKVDLDKFKTVLHHIVNKCTTLDNVGKTVVWKMLYFIDFDFFESTEQSLTGEEYRKLSRGPAPCDFDRAVHELEQEGKIEHRDKEYCGRQQCKFISLQQPNLKALNAEELSFIDREIEKLKNQTATQISALSHQDMPWKATKDGDIIDYELVFYRDKLLSVREYPGDKEDELSQCSRI